MAESFRFRRVFGTIHTTRIMSKRRFLYLSCILVSILSSGESLSIPGSLLVATIPSGWNTLPPDGPTVVLHNPGHGSARLSIAIAAGDPTAVCTSLRSSLLRIADGCQITDDDELPVGGRVWRRLRVRFAIGPVAFGQSAWIGVVSGKTVVTVLSAQEDDLPAHLGTATAVLNSLRSAQ